MAQSLSTAANIDVGSSAAISRFCEHLEFFSGHPPLIVRPLASGESNLNYYIKTERGEYVLRRYPLDTLGVCRQQELRCQHAAAAIGLAPAPLALNNHQQLLISDYISDGIPLALNTERLTQLAVVVAKLHSLTIQTPVLQVSQYLRQLMDNSQLASLEPAATLFSALLHSAEQMQSLPFDRVLCHMDLHQGNVLWAKQQIWLLDFEYAQLTDSSFDLAAICLNYQLNQAEETQLLQAYLSARHFSHSQTARDCRHSLAERLHLAKRLYSGFCWLWYQASPDKDAALRWQNKLAQLLALKPA
ncbi:phosphotransferase [Rheinheimera sp. UJ63]|uniref:phosphotransferase n=1 Tax=Rheinheimera sp. UJ63 TaxID=2910157 RepID=UPI001F2C00AD|nr:phosphotransferase [Rheinheimera sp. UJ63]MCF4008505.1 phosphotransferase [Rheinheimera sp. UJ63]